jgi:hypothetical protein
VRVSRTSGLKRNRSRTRPSAPPCHRYSAVSRFPTSVVSHPWLRAKSPRACRVICWPSDLKTRAIASCGVAQVPSNGPARTQSNL